MRLPACLRHRGRTTLSMRTSACVAGLVIALVQAMLFPPPAHAQTTGTRGKQESKHIGLGVELFHGGLAVLPADGAVDAACRVSHLGQVAVQQVQHLGHLR